MTRILLTLGVALWLCPATAWAQFTELTRAVPTGWVITPSFSIAEEYDDNVFVSNTNKQWDFITRFTPGLELGYRSDPFTLLLSGSIDAEIFARNTELSDPANRKRAGLHFKYLPYRLLTLGLDVSYFETNTPSELVPTTGLQLGRSRATELNVTPSVGYAISAIDTVTASYSYILDTFEGGTDNTTHRVKLGYARHLTALDTGAINYRLHVFENEGGGPTTITNTPTLAWTRQLTPNTLLTLEGGPRFVTDDPFRDNVVEPEAHGRIEHTFRLAKVALDYIRSEAVVVGRPGKVEVEAVSGLVEVEPVRLLRVRFEPGFYRTFGGADPEARVYGFLLTGLYPITSWLTSRLNYRFAYQDQAGETLPHNIVTLSLDVVYPVRVAP